MKLYRFNDLSITLLNKGSSSSKNSKMRLKAGGGS